MSRNQPGPRELELRALREAKFGKRTKAPQMATHAPGEKVAPKPRNKPGQRKAAARAKPASPDNGTEQA